MFCAAVACEGLNQRNRPVWVNLNYEICNQGDRGQVKEWDFLTAEERKAEASFTRGKKKNRCAEAWTAFYLAVSSIAQVREYIISYCQSGQAVHSLVYFNPCFPTVEALPVLFAPSYASPFWLRCSGHDVE